MRFWNLFGTAAEAARKVIEGIAHGMPPMGPPGLADIMNAQLQLRGI
jgi:hypothetical protein